MASRPRSVAQEIHQTRPFQSTGHELVVTLFRTSAVVERHFSAVMEEAGLTGAQYNVLRILRGAGPDGLPTLAIRDRLVDLSPGITRLIDRLENAGLVTRDRDAGDRRQVTCRITTPGLALLKRLDAPVDAAERATVTTLSPAEQRTLVRLLDLVRSGLAAPASEDL
jgi:DNA-binding MarR family transcriptional regulator